MNPITHFLVSWDVAAMTPVPRRDRAIITIAGILPDLDAFGILPELLTRNTKSPFFWWTDYHHVLGHNLLLAVLAALGSAAIAKKRWKTAALSFLTVHLHLLGDVIGARGPDGYQWPIPYLYPFSESWQLAWKGQWELNAWPNFVITFLALGWMFYVTWKRGDSPLEMVSSNANQIFVQTLRNRFGTPEGR